MRRHEVVTTQQPQESGPAVKARDGLSRCSSTGCCMAGALGNGEGPEELEKPEEPGKGRREVTTA